MPRLRATIMGLGRHGGGLGAARYLAGRGARVTITDLADEASLAEPLAQLRKLPIHALHLGGHDEADFRQADLVIVNPAVPHGHPLLEVAHRAGARLSSEIELLLTACRAPVIGVTGSVGKSTTCAMTAAILRAAMLRAGGGRVWLGGNLGGSLLDEVEQIAPNDVVVLELSSFQLAHLEGGGRKAEGGRSTPRSPHPGPLPGGEGEMRWPRTAVVTNFSANHLDWHGSLDHYRESKQALVRNLPPDGLAVLNRLDAELTGWEVLTVSRVVGTWPIDELPPLRLPGRHNQLNAALAAAAASSPVPITREALAGFKGLGHRLEFIGEFGGRRFYNDSKATTPEATLAALAAIDDSLWLLAGGFDKPCDFERLAAAIAHRVRGAALFGANRHRLAASIAAHSASVELAEFASLSAALNWCWRASRAGDAILLSPASASFDQYRDYAQRGDEFKSLVRALAQ
jgi:UDP-N-acetylmuramoylalanine--D-glutamate ligase